MYFPKFFRLWLFWLAVLLSGPSFAQKRDTVSKDDSVRVKSDTTKAGQIINNIKDSKVSKRLIKTITRKQSRNPGATIKSEEFFIPYEGKIIRKIIVRQVGFDKTITDTTRNIKNTISKIANKLHSNSKDWVIKDHLFIKENRPVNPYKMADNERYIRDLDFILDAKLFIVPLDHTDDSVDVIVMTRDVFSVGGSFNPSGPTKTRFRLYDVNMFGWGQRVQFTGLVDEGRNPPFGYEFQYRKNSIGGSFITATGGYTQLNTGSSYGREEEKAYYLRLERPLVSPYTELAGGLEISRNWSSNLYSVNDSVFRQYTYLVKDFWIGYNIGARSNIRDRNRHFIAIRTFDQVFTKKPLQNQETLNPIYNNRTFVLGGVTFFKQNFYTTRFIYGFGRTEDVPYGHTMSMYFGWSRELGLERPYLGFEVNKSIVDRRGHFYNVNFRGGGYNKNGLEDVSLLLSGSVFSRLFSYKNLLIRQTLGGDITYVFNQKTALPLDINAEFGLQGFNVDSLWGTKRFHINSETLVFTPLEFLGFKIAPFTYGEMAFLSPEHKGLLNSKPYFGLGGGLRTRNENLVFGTIELRFMYYPRSLPDLTNFKVRLSSNLRVKYSATFVKPPSLVQYN
ncbi:hypothetical protein [Chryseosolibacter indicus]|uniref:POTRA domain-containing protein n=1 Tax=Chryseosolibacter indicus TaxID=2782351 RepID=A0ABS5VMA6_9BACT|nr:hypothetical protein [Chryseosolibacter indicus]MBT1701984.1 hypothetical protein [Chryseosolibacter indicus]